MSAGRSLVVVGAGPAGLSAALAGAAAGMRVTVIDEAQTAGGQYFRGRQDSEIEGSPRHFLRCGDGTTTLLGAAVIDTPAAGVLSVLDERNGMRSIEYDGLVIATGAYDRSVALPGWTLPGVLTAGGASTLAKVHGVRLGKRVLLSGSGPFLLSVADDLSEKGCKVDMAEATPWAASLGGLPVLAADREIAAQTFGCLARLAMRGVRRSYGQLVTRIHGSDRVEGATIHRVDMDWRPIPGSEQSVEADTVCLGFGFVPQLELPQALGCALFYDETAANFFVRVDERMRTTQAAIYAAGEVTGIGGMRVAVTEGRLAGLTAAFDAGTLDQDSYEGEAASVLRRLRFVQRLATWIRHAYRPRPGLWALAEATTTLCRCEDVTRADAEAALENNPPTPYAVKTATRLGMGLCQGRICAPYLAEWLRAERGYQIPKEGRPWRIRPPLKPVPLRDWLAEESRP